MNCQTTAAQEEARAELARLADSPEFAAAYWVVHHVEHDRAVSAWTALWKQANPHGGAVIDPPARKHFQLAN
jgi:hypothetical protein